MLASPSVADLLQLLSGQSLLSLDFRDPPQQSFPVTADGVLDGLTATEIWLCDEASGNLIGELGSKVLVPTGSPLQGMTAVGFYDGSDMHSKKAVEVFENTNQSFVCSDTSLFNSDTSTSIALLIVLRAPIAPTANGKLVIGKLDSTPSGAGLQVGQITTGKLRVYCWSGGSYYGPCDSNASVLDGALHYACIVVDRTADQLKVFCDGAAVSTIDISAVGDMSGDTGLTLGRIVGFDNAAGIQVAYVAGFVGANAEGITQAKLDDFWQHGGQNFTPTFDSYIRASLCTSLVGFESGFGERVAKWSGVPSTPQFPYGYSSGFSHDGKLGGQFEPSATNLCTRSEKQSDWTQSNVTVTANDTEAPDGTKTADKLVATADNGYSKSANMTSVASTKYVGSVWIKRSGASDVSGRLIQYNEGGSSEDGSYSYTATSEWQRIQITPTAAGSTSTSLRIEIDTSGDGVYVWGAQFEAHDAGATSYIPTGSAAATRSSTVSWLANAGGNTYYNSSHGEVRVVGLQHADPSGPSDNYLWNIYAAGGGDADRNFMRRRDATNKIRWELYDSGAVNKQLVAHSPVTWTSEHVYRARWDSTDVLPGHSENGDIFVDDTRIAGSATTWTGGTNADRIAIGSAGSASGYEWGGLIATLEIFGAPRSD